MKELADHSFAALDMVHSGQKVTGTEPSYRIVRLPHSHNAEYS